MPKKELKAEPGDIIKIKTPKEEIEGTLLESHEPGILLLKLSSGYNIGVQKEDILDIEIMKKFKPVEEKEEKIKRKELPSISMIITGGTISSRLDYKTGAVSWLTQPSQLLKFYPEIFKIVNINKIEIPFMIASENMSYKEWQKIAKTAVKLLNDNNNQGIIITHGTDTLHYTSAALSFFLRNLNKPVILTYSQRSTDRGSSDASLNLQCSAQACLSDIAEVMIVGHASMSDNFCYALKGGKVRKMHTSRRDAFKPINTRPLAKIWTDKIEILGDYKKRNKNKVELDDSFEPAVALIKFYPGQNPNILDFYKNYKGIVIEMTGLGHVNTKGKLSWLPKLKKLIKSGVIVCASCQTLYGRLDPYVYSPGRELLKAGVIFLEDMLPECAFVKLGWVLGHREWAKNKEKVKEKMLENISGEFNRNLGTEFLI